MGNWDLLVGNMDLLETIDSYYLLQDAANGGKESQRMADCNTIYQWLRNRLEEKGVEGKDASFILNQILTAIWTLDLLERDVGGYESSVHNHYEEGTNR